MGENQPEAAAAEFLAAQARRRAAEIENTSALLGLREATITHLTSLVKMREAELAEVTALLGQRETALRDLEAAQNSAEPVVADWARLSVSERINACLPALDGWCTPAKAQWLAKFILERRALRILEIGIFGGKSLIPMALAAQSLGPAEVVGVEPWKAEVAVAEATTAENDAWWSSVDFAAIKTRFFASAARFGVIATIRVLETDSQAALALFERTHEPFDLIHIDGAHSPQRALDDARSWSRLVKPGGLIVFDDIEWPSVRDARTYLTQTFRVVDEVVEDGGSYGAYEKPVGG